MDGSNSSPGEHYCLIHVIKPSNLKETKIVLEHSLLLVFFKSVCLRVTMYASEKELLPVLRSNELLLRHV